MNCKNWEERIALSAGGDQDPAIQAEVQHHLAECAACRGFADGLADSLKLLRSAHAEPIAAEHYTVLRAGVMARLANQRRPWWHWMWAPALAAGLAAALFLTMRPVEKIRVTQAEARPPVQPFDQPRPVAPLVRRASTRPAPVRKTRIRGIMGPPPLVEPLVVKLVTGDPDIVIYWIADRKGEEE